jgi:hypothetical protein
VESWTVNVTGAFPVASATAQPPVQFTVADLALPTEKFLVTVAPGGIGSSQSWTVTRGAEGTTPVTHTGGFTIVNVTTGGFLTGVSQELSATAYVHRRGRSGRRPVSAAPVSSQRVWPAWSAKALSVTIWRAQD